MGLFRILKENLGSIKKQREIESSMLLGDNGKTTRLIGESISEILRAGLTKKQLATLEIIQKEHGETLNKLLSDAFQLGWARSGDPNLSNAIDEVLKAAQYAIKEYHSTMS